MSISVIIPVYKVEPYLRQCLDSVLNQTYRDLDILLIDDGSPDRCGEICEEYGRNDSRVRVYHTANHGLSAARNVGIREANGEYIGFVDSDDWIEPDMFEMLLRRLEDTEADLSVCGFWYDHSSYAIEKGFQEAVYTGGDALKALLKEDINNTVWSKLYRHALFQGLSFPEGKNFEDTAIMHEIVGKARTVALTSGSGYHYRQRSECITKAYTAKNLLDYVDAHLKRFYYFKECQRELFREEENDLLCFVAKGICKVWRWWHGCTKTEKNKNREKIEELKAFSRTNLPFSCSRSWPKYLRISLLFMHSSSSVSFFVLYYLNQLFRIVSPDKSNVLP